jgi:hypothetical protein
MKDHTMSAMHHYRNFVLMLFASFIAMYGLMYAMTNRFEDVFMNWNQLYMAALMTAPMGSSKSPSCAECIRTKA